jgi:hypothetical protein
MLYMVMGNLSNMLLVSCVTCSQSWRFDSSYPNRNIVVWRFLILAVELGGCLKFQIA